jgi:hypothetical protein
MLLSLLATIFDDLRGFLKYGNHVARFSFPFIAVEESRFRCAEDGRLDWASTPLPQTQKSCRAML